MGASRATGVHQWQAATIALILQWWDGFEFSFFTPGDKIQEKSQKNIHIICTCTPVSEIGTKDSINTDKNYTLIILYG